MAFRLSLRVFSVSLGVNVNSTEERNQQIKDLLDDLYTKATDERTGSVMRCPRHRQKEIVFENVKPKSCEKHHADNQLGYFLPMPCRY